MISNGLFQSVKKRCGIPEQVTVYDESEIKPLIQDCLEDMLTAGVPAWIMEDNDTETNPRVLTCITLYVQGMRGQDRTETNRYISLYRRKLHKLMLEPEIAPAQNTEG